MPTSAKTLCVMLFLIYLKYCGSGSSNKSLFHRRKHCLVFLNHSVVGCQISSASFLRMSSRGGLVQKAVTPGDLQSYKVVFSIVPVYDDFWPMREEWFNCIRVVNCFPLDEHGKRPTCKGSQGTNLAIRSFFVSFCIHLFVEDRPSSQSRITSFPGEVKEMKFKITWATKYWKYHPEPLMLRSGLFLLFCLP